MEVGKYYIIRTRNAHYERALVLSVTGPVVTVEYWGRIFQDKFVKTPYGDIKERIIDRNGRPKLMTENIARADIRWTRAYHDVHKMRYHPFALAGVA